jgi:hypothetical protein
VSRTEEVKPRYWWVEDLVNSDAKAMGTYLTVLFFIGPLRLVRYSIRDKPSGAFIVTIENMKEWLAFYFASRGEDIKQAYDASRTFVDTLFENETDALDPRERIAILSEIEIKYYDKFLKATKKYLKFDNIPEELKGIVREVLLDIRSQRYGGNVRTHAGTIELSEYKLRESIKTYQRIKEENVNELISCLERSGLMIRNYDSYIFPATCQSDEVIELLIKPEKPTERLPVVGTKLFIPSPPGLERFNEKPSWKILEEIVKHVLDDLGFYPITNVKMDSKTGSSIEVDVWAWKRIVSTRFSVYVSCKNWDRPIDRSVIDEEMGRVMNLREWPQLKVIITKEATLPAKRAAEADGFVIIELGKKAEAENAREIYELVYRAFNEIFASIAPPKLMGIVSRIEEAMETLKNVVEELTSLLTRRTER